MPLFRMYWQRVLRRPGSVFIWLAVPFVFMAIYTMVFGNQNSGPPKTTMAIVDQDSSFVSKLVKSALNQGPTAKMLTLVDAKDMDAVDEMFKKETASAALVIPDGFGERLLKMEPQNLTLYKNPRHYIGPQIAEGIVRSLTVIGDGLLGQFQQPMAQINRMDQTPTVEEIGKISESFYGIGKNMGGLKALRNIDVTIIEKEKDTESNDFNLAAMFFPGLIMFGLLSVALNLEGRFLRDRANHVTRRFVTAPITPWSVAIQQRLYTASFAFVVGIAAGTLGGLIWRIPPHGLGTAVLMIFALALFVSGWNGIVYSLSSSTRATSAISSISMVFLSLLGGGFFPLDFTPAGFQAITKLIPTGMINLALTHSLTGRPLGVSVPVILATCIAFFVVGTVLGRKRVL
ncbi:MAG TPA: ABC transporter permease [Candidatus Krumholzibacteria bacterium]|nr:ABC transporter permease [Candidatus Krumholzibacteria bacterium]